MPLAFLLILPLLVCGSIPVCTDTDLIKSALKLNYIASTINEAHRTIPLLEASCHKVNIMARDNFNKTAHYDQDIHCHTFPSSSSYCHLFVRYDESISIHYTITSSSSTSNRNDITVEADVRISFDVSIQEIAQETLISLATHVLPDLFSFAAESDASWTIMPVAGSSNDSCLTAKSKVDTVRSTLLEVFLSRPMDEVRNKRRLHSSKNIQVWEYKTPTSGSNKVISVFVNQFLRFTTATVSSIIHAEALVHPAVISHPKPTRVLVVSDFPIAILDELQKYDRSMVERIDIVGASNEIQQLLDTPIFSQSIKLGKESDIPVTFYDNVDHLSEMQDDDDDDDEPLYQFVDICELESIDYTTPETNIYQQSRSICYDKKVALENKRAGNDFERQVYCGRDTLPNLEGDATSPPISSTSNYATENNAWGYDVILMDIPSYSASELLSLDLHRKLKGFLDNDEGILALSVGAPPDLNDFIVASSFSSLNDIGSKKDYEDSSRDKFIRQAARHTINGGIGYKHIAVYDEPLATPLVSAFLIAFMSMESDSYARFYRSISAAIDFDVIERLVPGTTGIKVPPTLIYDGSTQLRYKVPTRNWEIWYCSTPPGMNLPGCSVLRSDIYNLDKNRKGVEVRKHPVKGRSVYATEAMFRNDFVNLDYTASISHLDALDWKALNRFVEDYPEATRYREVRDWFVAYGFDSISIGITGRSTSVESINTFVNHGCSEREVNTGPCEFIFVNEDKEPMVAFSPVINRYPFLAGISHCVIRDVSPGDEIAEDYGGLVYDVGNRPYFQMFLTEMCQHGKGIVVEDKDQPNSEL